MIPHWSWWRIVASVWNCDLNSHFHFSLHCIPVSGHQLPKTLVKTRPNTRSAESVCPGDDHRQSMKRFIVQNCSLFCRTAQSFPLSTIYFNISLHAKRVLHCARCRGDGGKNLVGSRRWFGKMIIKFLSSDEDVLDFLCFWGHKSLPKLRSSWWGWWQLCSVGWGLIWVWGWESKYCFWVVWSLLPSAFGIYQQ